VLAETAAEAARRFGDRVAFVTDDGLSLTYDEFNRLADETAVGLAERGVGEGDVVALVVPSVPEHFLAYVAAAKLGAITAAVNPKLVSAERAAVLRAANPRLVISTAALAPNDAVEPDQITVFTPATTPDEAMIDLRRPGQVPPPLATDPDRPIAIVFTSGTTGTPRAPCSAGVRSLLSPSATWGTNGGREGTPWPVLPWPIWAPPPSWPAI
jgi:acyl-CoA synthetase (AMP-forming)/AMP-acid ligase II